MTCRMVVTLAIFSVASAYGSVSESDATSVAVAWSRSAGIQGDVSFTGIVTNQYGDSMFHFCAGAGSVYVSSEYTLDPVVAYTDRRSATGAGISDGCIVYDMRPSGSVGSRALWNRLLGRAPLSFGPGTLVGFGQYIARGFEPGGTITHWGQTTGPGGRPLYNAYTRAYDSGGPTSGGLQLSFRYTPSDPTENGATNVPSAIPVGCVATAMSAIYQYYGITNFLVTSPSPGMTAPMNVYWSGTKWENRDSPASVTGDASKPIVGPCEWYKLPDYMGGLVRMSNYKSASAFWNGDDSRDARETIGKVAFNCARIAGMAFGWTESSAYVNKDFYERMISGLVSTGLSVHNPKTVMYSGDGDAVPTYCNRDDLVGFILWHQAGGVSLSTVTTSGSSSHCVVTCGAWSESSMVRVFYGWSGTSDGWYSASTIKSYPGFHITGYAGHVPLYGRILQSDGSPASRKRVSVFANGTEVGSTFTDTNGVFRTLYDPSSVASSAGSFVEVVRVSCGSSTNQVSSRSRTYITYSDGQVGMDSFNLSESNGLTYSLPTVGDLSGYDFVTDDVNLGDPVDAAKHEVLPLVISFGSSLAPVDGMMSCSVTNAAGSLLSEGEYLIIDPFLAGGRPTKFGQHVLAYGVSTNQVDKAEYVRKAKERFIDNGRYHTVIR